MFPTWKFSVLQLLTFALAAPGNFPSFRNIQLSGAPEFSILRSSNFRQNKITSLSSIAELVPTTITHIHAETFLRSASSVLRNTLARPRHRPQYCACHNPGAVSDTSLPPLFFSAIACNLDVTGKRHGRKGDRPIRRRGALKYDIRTHTGAAAILADAIPRPA